VADVVDFQLDFLSPAAVLGSALSLERRSSGSWSAMVEVPMLESEGTIRDSS
jgi:hypothetical protein